MVEVTLVIAFIAGIISFISPCILPLIPGYLSYLAGTSIEDIKRGDKKARVKIFTNAVFFVFGFAIVFSVIGLLLNTLLANVAYGVLVWLGRVGGVVIIALVCTYSV